MHRKHIARVVRSAEAMQCWDVLRATLPHSCSARADDLVSRELVRLHCLSAVPLLNTSARNILLACKYSGTFRASMRQNFNIVPVCKGCLVRSTPVVLRTYTRKSVFTCNICKCAALAAHLQMFHVNTDLRVHVRNTTVVERTRHPLHTGTMLKFWCIEALKIPKYLPVQRSSDRDI